VAGEAADEGKECLRRSWCTDSRDKGGSSMLDLCRIRASTMADYRMGYCSDRVRLACIDRLLFSDLLLSTGGLGVSVISWEKFRKMEVLIHFGIWSEDIRWGHHPKMKRHKSRKAHSYICTATLRESPYCLNTRLIRGTGLSSAIRIIASRRDKHSIVTQHQEKRNRTKRKKSHHFHDDSGEQNERQTGRTG
jgi:hypothetical protein